MQQLLMEHQDVFTWSHKSMLGIDPEIMQHPLSVDPKAKGVRKKCRRFSTKKNTVIAVEVVWLLTT